MSYDYAKNDMEKLEKVSQPFNTKSANGTEKEKSRVKQGGKGYVMIQFWTNCSNYLEIKTNGNHACNHNATTEEKCLELYPIVKLSVSGKRCSITISEFHPVPIVKIYSIKIIWSKLVIGKITKIP